MFNTINDLILQCSHTGLFSYVTEKRCLGPEMRSVLTPAITMVLHMHLQLVGHLPPEFKKRTAKVTFSQAHVLADVASAVTDRTENRTFQERSRFKSTMKTPRHLMGVWLSFILPPVEQRTAEVCPCGARR